MVVSILHTGRVRGSRCAAQGSRCCGSAPVTSCAGLCQLVPGTFSFLAQRKSLINNTLSAFVPLVPLVPAFSSSFTDLKDIPILFFKSNFDLKMLAQLAQMATAPVNPHFLLAQTWHKTWHKPGTDPLFPAQIQNHCSLCPLTADHEPRSTTQAYRFALHAHRSVSFVNWLILTDSLLVVVLFRRRN